MPKTISFTASRLLMALALCFGMLMSISMVETSTPIISSTETIVVPNVLTGEPMELEVERGAVASADAAAYMKIDCSLRRSSGVKVTVFPWGTLSAPCGSTQGDGANSVNQVKDENGPGCVYYGSTLAGCGGKNVWLYVGNRLNYTGTFKLSPTSI